MSRLIYCNKLHQQAEGLAEPPFPGPFGQRIFDEISREAWQQWLQHQTMLINEYRLNTTDPKARATLRAEMEKFLFGDGSAKPAGYVPEQ